MALFTDAYKALFTHTVYTIPTTEQLLSTAARLGADVKGSAFTALTALGMDDWMDAANEEHHLITEVPAKGYKGYARFSEEAILHYHEARRMTLPVPS